MRYTSRYTPTGEEPRPVRQHARRRAVRALTAVMTRAQRASRCECFQPFR